jgi:hypothetical protein
MVKLKQVVATLAATVEKNQRLTIRELAAILDMTFATVQYTVTVEVGRVNKSAHCCPVPEKRKESSAVRASFSSFSRVPWWSWTVLLPWTSLPCLSTPLI